MSTHAASSPKFSAPSLRETGAIQDPDGTTAAHFGDPFAEQRACARGAAVLDTSDREVLVLTGAERLSWLEGFVTQHITDLPPGSGSDCLILDANGRVEHVFGLTVGPDAVYLDTAPGHGEALYAFLDRMVFWAAVEPRLAPEYAVLSVLGARAASTLLPLLADEGAEHLPGLRAARTLAGPAAGAVTLIVEREELDAAWRSLVSHCGAVMGSWAADAWRTEVLRPAAADLDAKTIPHEVPSWIGDAAAGGAVHLNKGCYRGQETVARVHNLGRAPRVLVRLLLDGSADELPAPGTAVTAGGRTIGRLGTTVQHHELGPVALALVKRNVGADIDLETGGMAARIDPDSLPDDSAPQAGREAVRRLRGL